MQHCIVLYAAPLPPRAYSDIFGGLRFALESHSETLHNSFRGSVHAVAPCAYAVQIKVHEAELKHSLRCFGGISLAPKCFVNRVAEFRLLPVIAKKQAHTADKPARRLDANGKIKNAPRFRYLLCKTGLNKIPNFLTACGTPVPVNCILRIARIGIYRIDVIGVEFAQQQTLGFKNYKVKRYFKIHITFIAV